MAILEETESGSIEVSPNFTAELKDKWELIGIEILSNSDFIWDPILESVQTKMLKFSNVHSD